MLFAILQKYDFSSKSQLEVGRYLNEIGCLRYCKSTIFQANHNVNKAEYLPLGLFAILQKYDFSSKSQHQLKEELDKKSCLRYCKSTIFQANHNGIVAVFSGAPVVCDTAKVRFFKQITTGVEDIPGLNPLFAILQKYDFSSKSQHEVGNYVSQGVVCDTAKVRFFKQITTIQ